ncbi:MAG: hypothetical protein LC785_00630 [Acidobacteria bacterium]|nr:hypothetical protein [Acidobacteriota bacterium]
MLLFCGLILLSVVWLWWDRPERVEMASYVPQDSLIYIEADSVPDILAALTTTAAWRSVAPAAGVRANVGRLGWLTRFAGWTGIGSAESVVFARAQVAVAVLSVDAKEGRDLALEISPRIVIVAETHASESRARNAVTKFVGEFARKAYGDPKFEQADRGGTLFETWTAPASGKKIVAAFSGSAAFVGNDESAVQACLAAHRGERAAMSSDPELAGMRQRVGAQKALAFGYVPQSGAPKLTQLAALVLASRRTSRRDSPSRSKRRPMLHSIQQNTSPPTRTSSRVTTSRSPERPGAASTRSSLRSLIRPSRLSPGLFSDNR